jgi:GR25 family glycosyltransferase involved in LPS biosynthesis
MMNYVINLDKRVERWYYVREHLHDIGIRVQRFPAIETKPGWRGCAESHLRILSKMEMGGITAIYEDDVMFLQPLEVMYKALDQLPDDWDCLYLGASPKEPQERYSENLFRLKNAHVTHAIIWYKRIGGAVEYILSHKDEIKKIDDFFATVIQPRFNCFVAYPIVAIQKQFQSDTCHRSDVSTIQKNYNLYCK